MLFDHSFSTVSVCSERHCGIECGQKILPINGHPAAYGEYFCCVYVTLQNHKSQVIFSVPAIQILDSINKEKGIEKRHEKWYNIYIKFITEKCYGYK